jgi:hypothetical protein
MSINRSDAILQYDQSFVVNGYQLSGVDSVQVSYSVPLENALTLGSSFGYNLNNPMQAEISLQRSCLYQDPLLAFTGDSSFSGSFRYNGLTYGFTSGFLNRYSISCSVGDVPQISASINVYGDLKPSLEVLPYQAHPAIYIPSPRSMLVSGDNSTNNRIKSFNYELTINRQAVYSLDSYSRVDEVVFLPPVTVSASLDFDAVNFTPEDYKYFISSAEKKNFKVIINDRNINTGILNLDIPNIQLSSQQLSSSADNKLSITNSYIGYLS